MGPRIRFTVLNQGELMPRALFDLTDQVDFVEDDEENDPTVENEVITPESATPTQELQPVGETRPLVFLRRNLHYYAENEEVDNDERPTQRRRMAPPNLNDEQ